MKRNSLKYLGLCFALLLIFALIACGTDEDSSGSNEETGDSNTNQNEDTSESSDDSSDTDDKLVFGNIAYDMKDVWNKYSTEAFEYAGEKMGVETIILDAENDLEKSVTLMESLIQQDVDGISIFPISPEQAATLVQMGNDAGIPVTIENTRIPDDAGDIVSTVATEYDLIGEEAFHFIAEEWPGAKVLSAAGAKGGGVYDTYLEVR